MTEPQPGWYPPVDPNVAVHHPYGYPDPYYQPARPTNGLAIAAMVVSIVSIVTCPCPLGIPGALMGHAARRQIRERGESGEGMATAGIVIGWITTGLVVLVIAFYVVLFVIIGVNGGFDEPTY